MAAVARRSNSHHAGSNSTAPEEVCRDVTLFDADVATAMLERRKQEARNQSPLKGCLLLKPPGVQEAYDFIGTFRSEQQSNQDQIVRDPEVDYSRGDLFLSFGKATVKLVYHSPSLL